MSKKESNPGPPPAGSKPQPPPCRLTPEENIVLDHITTAFELFEKLEQYHPDDINEFRFHTHCLQEKIGNRLLARLGIFNAPLLKK